MKLIRAIKEQEFACSCCVKKTKLKACLTNLYFEGRKRKQLSRKENAEMAI